MNSKLASESLRRVRPLFIQSLRGRDDLNASPGKMPAATTSAAPSSMVDPIATTRKYVDDFNRGDMKAIARPASVLDGLLSHVWHGPTAGEDWYRGVLATGKREGASDYFVTVDEPGHFEVTGDSTYVVVPPAMGFECPASSFLKRARSLRPCCAGSPSPRLAHDCLGVGERHSIARCREDSSCR